MFRLISINVGEQAECFCARGLSIFFWYSLACLTSRLVRNVSYLVFKRNIKIFSAVISYCAWVTGQGRAEKGPFENLFLFV